MQLTDLPQPVRKKKKKREKTQKGAICVLYPVLRGGVDNRDAAEEVFLPSLPLSLPLPLP